MVSAIRDVLRKNLSLEAYRSANNAWWTVRHYLPRLAISLLVHRHPAVENFSFGGSSSLSQTISKINTVALTKMCHVIIWHGSDKGSGRHDYTKVYSALFSRLSKKSLRIFELGLGSKNPDMPFYMGENARPGASLRGWRELFPSSLIYGADLDRQALFKEKRISTFYCDQLDQSAISDLWSQPELQGGMDIIIDDGHHTFEANVSFLEGSLKHLNPGGVYVVEDITRSALEDWRQALRNIYANQFHNHEFALVELDNPINKDDNNLLIIRRTL